MVSYCLTFLFYNQYHPDTRVIQNYLNCVTYLVNVPTFNISNLCDISPTNDSSHGNCHETEFTNSENWPSTRR